jgi:copper chaperone
VTRIYSVPGISCEHCKHVIEGAVGKLEGIDRVDVDVATKTVRVLGEVNDSAIRAAIDDAGYEVAASS